jgi:uncharacterized protein (TIGR00730 family)
VRDSSPSTSARNQKDHICVFGGASSGASSTFPDVAAELGRALTRAGLGVVYGAGGVGVMGALSDAVLSAGGDIVGVIPEGLMAREYGRRDLTDLRVVASMHERKQLMHNLSRGFIALPGGLGTLEDLLEAVTWTQLGLHDKPVVLLNVEGYFDPLLTLLSHAVEQGFMTPADRDLMAVTNDIDTAIRHAVGRRHTPEFAEGIGSGSCAHLGDRDLDHAGAVLGLKGMR